MSITITFTTATAFTIRFAFGDDQMQMSYTLDGSIDNYFETAYFEAYTDEDGITHDDIPTIGWKENGKRASYMCFTSSDLNYLSIRTFSEFATSILSGKSARLTQRLQYDADTNALILLADNGTWFGRRTQDIIQCKYYLNNSNLDAIISQLNHINTQIELAGQILDGHTA